MSGHAPPPTAQVAPVLGIACFVGPLESAACLLADRASSGLGGYACLANAHVLVSAHHDMELWDALEKAWTVFPDGAPVAWLQRRGGATSGERVGGPDLMTLVCARRPEQTQLRHFLLGSTSAVLEQLKKNLERRHPGIAIVGSYGPARSEIEGKNPQLIERIRSVDPHIVWCALGAPRQELWMAGATSQISSCLLVGVGAAFEFIAGTKRRAPQWMQRTGLEWAHRLGSEPRRLAGRYVRTNTEFVIRAGLEVALSNQRSTRVRVNP